MCYVILKDDELHCDLDIVGFTFQLTFGLMKQINCQDDYQRKADNK